MKNIEEIVDLELIKFINKKLHGNVVLCGRRALALAGITFGRPFTADSDHDFITQHLSMRHTLFDSFFKEANMSDGYGGKIGDDEEVAGTKHYFFDYKHTIGSFSDKRHCLFVQSDLVTTTVRGIKIADPEQILFYKHKYVEKSDKHRKDFENINKLGYNLKNL